ncbi:MAG: septum formation initiator family protein [Lentisphaeria bacterium]|nr:septum formation initiator family protein [Lentisphaeria bacterium]
MKTEQFLFTIACIVIVCALGYFLLPVYAEYKDAAAKREKLELQLITLEYECQQLEKEIHALNNNPKAVERVARENLGWCRPDEKIYHFDPPPVSLIERDTTRGETLP